MTDSAWILVIIAGLGAFAMVVSRWVHRFVPEIVVFLALGIAIGPDGPVRLINEDNLQSLNLLTQVGLGMIIFMIGDRLRLDELKGQRRTLVPMNLGHILLTSALVFLAVQWVGADPRVSLVLALIAAESGVLTVTATIKEQRAGGRLSNALLSSVGITNVAVAAMFGIAFPFVLAATGAVSSQFETALVFGRIVVISTAIGLVGAWLLRSVGSVIETSGELMLVLILVITGMDGLAVVAEGSVVVATLVCGLVIANRAPWLADRLFAVVRTLEAPIYLVFFVVAGASIHLDELAAAGGIGLAYALARTVGKVGGAALGAQVAPEGDARFGARVGMGLLPHAGMAIALVAFVVESAPALGETVSAVVLGSIVVFELAGPLVLRRVLRATQERGAGAGAGNEWVVPSLDPTTTFRRILIPVGNLDVLLPRLPFLLDLVGNLNAQIIAVHVARPDERGEPGRRDALRAVSDIAAERNILVEPVQVVSEQIAKALVEAAEEHRAELIIMGEPARTSFLEPSRWGQVTQRVVRHVDVPVLVYPVDPTRPADIPGVYLERARRAERSDRDAAPARSDPRDEQTQPSPS